MTGWFALSDRITAACDQHAAIETEIFFGNIMPSDSGGKCSLPINNILANAQKKFIAFLELTRKKLGGTDLDS